MIVGWQSCTIFNVWHLNIRKTTNCILSSSSLTRNSVKHWRKSPHGWEGPLEVQEWKSHHLPAEHFPACREHWDTFGIPTTDDCHMQAHFDDSIWTRFPASPRSLRELNVHFQMCCYYYHLCVNIGIQPFTSNRSRVNKDVGALWAWLKSNSY